MIFDDQLNLLTQVAKALSVQFGEDCEIVIHRIDEKDIDNTIVYIENGHVTSRRLGDGPSMAVMEAVNKDPRTLKDEINYLTRTHDGRILKSSTIYLKDHDGKLTGIFAINYDITNMIVAENAIKTLVSINEEEKSKGTKYIPKDVNELLDDLIEESVKLVGKPVPLMSKNDKIKCVQFLNDKGAFLVTKSGDKVSEFFNISKYTLYSYLDAK
ncbi:MAG: helix-turn-helix transcriptional regulator [Lachnospiraceae bacterium]|nr:helix-turn-helix transcriptional regulator [Lachnospiraceae bacterium]